MTCAPLKLLFVDDDDDIRAIVELALGMDGEIDLRLATGGYEALKMIAQPGWRPDCVLLDAHMPDVSGEMVLAAIRQRADAADLPVILLTANVRAGDVARYHERGAAGVIAKPFDPTTLARDVRRVLFDAAAPPTHQAAL